jgi:hypothetical protein
MHLGPVDLFLEMKQLVDSLILGRSSLLLPAGAGFGCRLCEQALD